MDDPRIQAYFCQPTQTSHRQYEALRAVFVEGRPQKEVADKFGYAYDSLRQLVSQFRRMTDTQRKDFFFATRVEAGPPHQS